MAFDFDCPYMSAIHSRKESNLVFGVLDKGFVFQGVAKTTHGGRTTTFTKGLSTQPCPPWYGVTHPLKLLTLDDPLTFATLKKYYRDNIQMDSTGVTPDSIAFLLDTLNPGVPGLLTRCPRRMILVHEFLEKDVVVPLADNPTCRIHMSTDARFYFNRLSKKQQNTIHRLAKTFCRERSRFFDTNTVGRVLFAKLSSRPSPYTCLRGDALLHIGLSVEHLVPLVLWDPFPSAFLLNRNVKYSMNAARDIYNMALEGRGINQVRSSIPFGSVSLENKDEGLVLLVKGSRFDFVSSGDRDSGGNAEMKEWVVSTLCRSGMTKTSLNVDDPSVCKAQLPSSLRQNKVDGNRYILCTDDPCKWEPPNDSKGWIARCCLWVLTVHWVAPYLSNVFKVKLEGLVWMEKILFRLIDWDRRFPVTDEEQGWAKGLSKLCGYHNAFVTYRDKNYTDKVSLGDVLYLV